MATPQMMALDQALAEIEVPPPDPGRWAEQLAGVARQNVPFCAAAGSAHPGHSADQSGSGRG